MGRSDSDSDYEKRKKKKKKERNRSRSRSRSSERNGRRSHKSSRDRRSRSRSRSRDRRSRSRDRKRSRSRSRDRRRNHSRSRSRSRERSRRHRSRSSSRSRTSRRGNENEKKTKDLKNKIEALSVQNDKLTDNTMYKPSTEQLAKIEKDSFVQEHFSKTNNQSNPPPQQQRGKKKKKKKGQLIQQQKVERNSANSAINGNESEPKAISHDDAIFGKTSDALAMMSKFSTRIDSKRKEELKCLESDEDLLFGALFNENPEVRMKRWFEKLQIIRKRIRETNSK